MARRAAPLPSQRAARRRGQRCASPGSRRCCRAGWRRSGRICCTAWPTRCPSAGAGRGVVTVYDLSFLRYPAAFNVANRIYLTASTRAAVRRARRVLTISEHTRRDIVRLLSVPEQRVDVTYPAAEERYRASCRRAEVEAFRVARGLPEAFIFAVGTLEPRKNLVGLLHAYARLAQPATAAVSWRRHRLAVQSHLRHSASTGPAKARDVPGLRPGR